MIRIRKVGRIQMSGKLRIIGGQWRGRKLPVADLPGLRPTTDRIRETVFNWLAPTLAGRRCLDLFAGTGALGLEALSRGATSCCFIERQRPAAALLRQSLATLQATGRGTVLEIDALDYLRQTALQEVAGGGPEVLDLVFLDPPFDGELLAPALEILAHSPRLSADALVYLEYSAAQIPTPPAHWVRWRHKRSGNVVYELYACAAEH